MNNDIRQQITEWWDNFNVGPLPSRQLDNLTALIEEREVRARYDERMSTVATKDGRIYYLDGAKNKTLTDKDRIAELQAQLKPQEADKTTV